jgi:GT2 family glycosyltransferase
MTPLAWIIVLNWNGRRHLQDCLGSLSHNDYPNYKVLLVDNNSQDGSVYFVEKNFPDVQIIVNSKNLGFAEGNNVGIRHALSQGAAYIVLLNNDTRVEPDFLSRLITRGEEKKDVGVLGGKVLMFDNPEIVNSTGINLNLFAYGWDRDFGEKAAQVARPGGEVLGITGCLMAVKKEVFERVGLLDPDFISYYEDLDFCLRVWEYTDYKIEYVPDSVIYHKFSASSSVNSHFKRRQMTINRYRLFFKHFPARDIIKIFPLLTIHRAVMLFGHLRKLDFGIFFMEILILFKYWALFPISVFNRMSEYKRGVNRSLFREKIIPEMKRPFIKTVCFLKK